MPTPRPAAGTAHAGDELGDAFFDPDVSRLGFFAGFYPADPLVAGEGCDVLPGYQSLWGGDEGLFEVYREFVYCATGDLVVSLLALSLSKGSNHILGHGNSIAKNRKIIGK